MTNPNRPNEHNESMNVAVKGAPPEDKFDSEGDARFGQSIKGGGIKNGPLEWYPCDGLEDDEQGNGVAMHSPNPVAEGASVRDPEVSTCDKDPEISSVTGDRYDDATRSDGQLTVRDGLFTVKAGLPESDRSAPPEDRSNPPENRDGVFTVKDGQFQRLDPRLSGTGASQDPGLLSLHLQNRAGDFVDGSGGPSPGWLGPTRTWTSTETSASDLMVHLRARRRSALSLLGSKLDA